METEKRRKKIAAVVNGTQTPKKSNSSKAKKSVIGSSSTWKDEQSDLFRVKIKDCVDGSGKGKMIPEKWFYFGDVNRYQQGNRLCLFWLVDGSAGYPVVDSTGRFG